VVWATGQQAGPRGFGAPLQGQCQSQHCLPPPALCLSVGAESSAASSPSSAPPASVPSTTGHSGDSISVERGRASHTAHSGPLEATSLSPPPVGTSDLSPGFRGRPRSLSLSFPLFKRELGESPRRGDTASGAQHIVVTSWTAADPAHCEEGTAASPEVPELLSPSVPSRLGPGQVPASRGEPQTGAQTPSRRN
jgi:hypothetical protein